jgi:hypothetical protein
VLYVIYKYHKCRRCNMGNKAFRVFFLLLAVLGLFTTSAFARWHSYGWHNGGWHRWYGPGWFGVYVSVPCPPIGTIVETLPPGYTVAILGGVPYYYCQNVYYRTDPEGYIVVAPPQINSQTAPEGVSGTSSAAAKPAGSASGSVTLNVPNSSGGYTPVTLKKYKNGYVGPQGEFYQGNPTIEQLKVLYGQ